jgi:hypothetical protein
MCLCASSRASSASGFDNSYDPFTVSSPVHGTPGTANDSFSASTVAQPAYFDPNSFNFDDAFDSSPSSTAAATSASTSTTAASTATDTVPQPHASVASSSSAHFEFDFDSPATPSGSRHDPFGSDDPFATPTPPVAVTVPVVSVGMFSALTAMYNLLMYASICIACMYA